MKALLLVLAVFMSATAGAQVTCQQNGNTTYCNGSLNEGIKPVAPVAAGISVPSAAQQVQTYQAIQAARAAQDVPSDFAKAAHAKAEAEKHEAAARKAAAAASTEELKAKVATLEAVMRNSPPDSNAFRSATAELGAVNVELAKRGEIK